MKREEWDYWLAFDDVHPAVAVALSMGVSPNQIDIMHGEGFQRFRLFCAWFNIHFELAKQKTPRFVLVGENRTVNLRAVARRALEKGVDITCEFAELAGPIGKAKAPEQKSLAQDRRILEIIEELGFDPNNLPEYHPGKPSTKSKARAAALRERSLFSSSSFDRAWKRLSKAGSVKYGR
jgi:hypothetical protein